MIGILRLKYKQVHWRNLRNYFKNKIIIKIKIKKLNNNKIKDYCICYSQLQEKIGKFSYHKKGIDNHNQIK